MEIRQQKVHVSFRSAAIIGWNDFKVTNCIHRCGRICASGIERFYFFASLDSLHYPLQWFHLHGLCGRFRQKKWLLFLGSSWIGPEVRSGPVEPIWLPFYQYHLIHFAAFSVYLPCVANSSGIAMFSIGLVIKSIRGKSIPGTPLRLSLRKECAHRGVYDRGSLSTIPQGSVCFSIFLHQSITFIGHISLILLSLIRRTLCHLF